jgi:aminoglycoside N3'-acetyltransferase
VPDGFEPVAAIAVGYGEDVEDIPEAFRQAESGPRSRRPIQSFVFQGQWGQPSPLISA